MSRMKGSLDWRVWIWALILAFLLPYLSNELSIITVNFKIIVLMFIVNSIYSVVVGLFLRRHGAFWYLLLVWPALFALGTLLHLNSRDYGYFFAVLYLVIGVIAFTHGQTDDVDFEDQIPVDGGFKG